MGKSPIRWVFGMSLLSALLLAFAPAVALADDPTNIGQTLEQTTETVNQTAEQTTETVNQTAEQTTETVNQTAEQTTGTVNQTAEQTTGTVNQTAEQTTGTVNQTAEQTTGTVNQTANAPASDAGGGSGGLQPGTRQQNTTSNDVYSDSAASGPRAAPDLLTDRASTLTANQKDSPSDDSDPQADPCNEDTRLVCLGLLFGLGDFADTGADVLGVMVRTGADVVVLAAIALLLGLLGVALLAASSDRFGFASIRAH